MFGLGIGVFEQGLILGLLALGVYITYKILDFSDLSVEGTFVLGSSVSAILIFHGINPLLATIAAIIAGAIGGLCTGILHVHLRIKNILASILVMSGLYSINLRITKLPNLPISKAKGIYSLFRNIKPNNPLLKYIFENELFLIMIIILIVKVALDLFLKTKLGMLLRITGDNPNLVTSLGINIGHMKILGLMLANGIVALSGSLLAQYQSVSDIASGSGKIVIGLAAVILGEAFLGKFEGFIKPTTMAFFGAILYNIVSLLTLRLGLNPSDFKLVSALIIITILGINNHKESLRIRFNFKKSRLSVGKGEEAIC